MNKEPTVLKNDDKIKFVPMTKNWGRAEFTFCTHYNKGILDKVYITRQQQGVNESFVINPIDKDCALMFSDVINNIPRIWNIGWCKEHNCQYMRAYIPENTNTLEISILTNIYITFTKGDKNDRM